MTTSPSRKRITRLASTGAALALIAACSGGDDDATSGSTVAGDDELEAVRISLTPVADMAPYWLGVDLGFYEEVGLDVTIETNQGGAAALPSIMTGDIQFGSANPNTVYIAADQGLDPRILATTSASSGVAGEDTGAILTMDGSEIRSPADLVGATVAVPTFNSIGDVTVSNSVQAVGADHTGVNFVELGFPEMLPALQNGQVDAVFMVEPFLSTTVANGGRVISWTYLDMVDHMPITSLYTSAGTLEERGDMVDLFVEASMRSFEFATDNPDEITRILGTYTELSEEVIERMTLPQYPGDLDVEGYRVFAERMVDLGTLSEMPDLDAIIVSP